METLSKGMLGKAHCSGCCIDETFPILISEFKASQHLDVAAMQCGCCRQKGLDGWELVAGHGPIGLGGPDPRAVCWEDGGHLLCPDPLWPSLHFILGAGLPDQELGDQRDRMSSVGSSSGVHRGP